MAHRLQISRKLVAAWVLSLALVGGIASTWTAAQVRQPLERERIVSGSDLGFKIEGQRGEHPIGTLMVRVDGRWVEAGWSLKLTPAK